MSHEIKIYTDASYRHKTQDGSYTYIILIDDKISHQFCKSTVNIKSNCLEFMGIQYAIKNILKHYLPNITDISSIKVYTDSQNCINYISNKWKVKNEILVKIKNDVDNMLETIEKNYKLTIKFYHVSGHKNNILNNMVDKIATMVSEYNRNRSIENGESR